MSTHPDERTALQAYAATKAAQATVWRDDNALSVSRALGSVQPDLAALGCFLEATESAFAVEAWMTFLKRPKDNAVMTMHHWSRPRTLTPHPVNRLVAEIKAHTALDVIEDLADKGMLTPGDMRIFLIGLKGLDEDPS